MKIVFFNATTNWGGVKSWTIDVAAQLQLQGHETILVGKDTRFAIRAEQKNIRAITTKFGSDFSPISIVKFLSFLRKERPDVVIVNVSKELRTVGFAAKLLQIPLVQRIGLPKDMKCCKKVQLLDTVLTPHYLFPCYFNRDGMLAHLPFVKKNRTTVVHTGKPCREVSISSPSKPFQFITTSQLNERKGHSELMDAMHILSTKGVPFHWHIVGTGTEEAVLKKRSIELNLSENITWHGWTQDVFSLLEKADSFLLPSYFEGLPNTLLEAMSCGLIPVARNVGGIHEAWPNELNQLLIDQDADATIWAEKLYHLMTTPEDIVSKNKSLVKQHIDTHFNINQQAKKLVDELEKVIQSTGN